MVRNLSIYIHYPFCLSKCPYCDFNSHIADKIDYKDYINAYYLELESFFSKTSKRKITSIFFGGGTPSLMPISMVEEILGKINKLWHVDNKCEITMEVNPTSFEVEKFKELKKIGINRLSVGIQSLNDRDLKFLGRNHNAKDSIKALNEVANIYDNFSFDLIYARPSQDIDQWINELRLALSFASTHLSLYQLTIEKGTSFYKDFKDQKFTMPSDELSSLMFEKTNIIMQESGFINYEISNYAKNNKSCLHNLCYWLGGDYIGIGPGAHSRLYFDDDLLKRYEIIMTYLPQKWLNDNLKQGNAIKKKKQILKSNILEELILTALRTNNGLSNDILKNHNFLDLRTIFDYRKLLKIKKNNMISLEDDSIKIAKDYRFLANSVIFKVANAINFNDLR